MSVFVKSLKEAGRAVVKSFSNVIAPSENDGYWYFMDGAGSSFTYTGCNDAIKAYEQCPPFASIINSKTRSFTNGKLWVMDRKGKEATNDKAISIRRLLANPNPLQSGLQFRAQYYAYTELFGWSLMLVVRPAGFKENIDASALWNIPPHMVDIEETRKLFYQDDKEGIIKSISLNWDGKRVLLPVEDCFIIQGLTPSIGNMMFPESPVKPLALPISNIIGAYESRNEIINHRGARGIITNRGVDAAGVMPIPTPEKEALEDHFKGRYGLRRGMSQFIITSAMVDFVSIGQNIKDLQLMEEVEADRQEICDGYGYPADLVSRQKGSTFNNVNASEKRLYQNTIIPESGNIDDQLNTLFDTEKHRLKIEYDYSHIDVLQEDKKAQAEAKRALATAVIDMYKNGIVTLNRAREIMDEDTVAGEDTYYDQNNEQQETGESETQEEG